MNIKSLCGMIVVGMGTLLAAGCASEDPSVDEWGESEDALAKSKVAVAGSITLGTSTNVAYNASPRYRALSFIANAGDKVDFTVTSATGDAYAYLLDANFRTLASNDNESASTKNARVRRTIAAQGTYYIALRDKAGMPNTFRVAFLGVPPAPPAPPSPPPQGSPISAKAKSYAGHYYGGTSLGIKTLNLEPDGTFSATRSGVSAPQKGTWDVDARSYLTLTVGSTTEDYEIGSPSADFWKVLPAIELTATGGVSTWLEAESRQLKCAPQFCRSFGSAPQRTCVETPVAGGFLANCVP